MSMDLPTASIANIGPDERRKRLTVGVVTLCITGAIAVALVASELARGWRLLLFLPLWAAALGVFQARDNT
jgi:hypothetical protein